MGLSIEEARKILRLKEGDESIFIARKHYRRLAYRYFPGRNPYRRDFAVKKFQKIVEAYVRLQIDPDDCDQMKIKRIITEIYALHEEISTEKDKDYFSSDSDSDDPIKFPYHLYPPPSQNAPYSSSPFDSTNGPYSSLLQDFTLRSYMCRRTKSNNNKDTETKRYVSKEARERASKLADELLKDEEDEKTKEERRRHRNKKKKETKKRKKGEKPSDDVDNGGTDDEDDDTDDEQMNDTKIKELKSRKENGTEKHNDEEFDISSAFFARINSKVVQPPVIPQQQLNKDTVTESKPQIENKSPNMEVNKKETVKEKREVIDTPPVDVKKKSSSSSKVLVKDHHETDTKEQRGHYYRPYYQSELPPRLLKKLGKQRHGRENSATPKVLSDSGSDHVTSKTTSTVDKEQLVEKEIKNDLVESALDRSRKLAVLGNTAAREGKFEDAIVNFTSAIELYPFDHRYFGNRSFCYEYLKDYEKALEDASTAIKLKSDWPKGHFRKGKALAGLEKYVDAQEAFEKALEFDPDYTDANEELKKMKETVLELTIASTEILESIQTPKEDDIHVVTVESVESTNEIKDDIVSEPVTDDSTKEKENTSNSQYEVNKDQNDQQKWNKCSNLPPRMKHLADPKLSDTLWVGNIDPYRMNEEMLCSLFKKCGKVVSVHILPHRYCAFVRYEKPESTALALSKLQNSPMCGCSLVLRYPEHPSHSFTDSEKKTENAPKKPVAPNTNECYFWRTTGCYFGENCHYLHIKKNRGIDLKVSRSKYYYYKRK